MMKMKAGLKRLHFRALGILLALTLTLSLFGGISVRADGTFSDSGLIIMLNTRPPATTSAMNPVSASSSEIPTIFGAN